MIVVLMVGTLLGGLEFAFGLRDLRERLSVIQADGTDAGGSLAAPALMVLGGAAALAVGLALLPFAAAGAIPDWVSTAAGGSQLVLVLLTGGMAMLLRRS